MTSMSQEGHGALPNEADGTRWTTRQVLAVTLGSLLSITLWSLTPITHSASGGWLSNLIWTMAATATLGTTVFVAKATGNHRQERRMQRVEHLVQRMYDRQEELAGEIQKQQSEAAEDMLGRQREIADRLTQSWKDHQEALDAQRKRLGKLVALEERRNLAAKMRNDEFKANSRELAERMEALALLIETRMPPRQLGYKHRGDGA